MSPQAPSGDLGARKGWEDPRGEKGSSVPSRFEPKSWDLSASFRSNVIIVRCLKLHFREASFVRFEDVLGLEIEKSWGILGVGEGEEGVLVYSLSGS